MACRRSARALGGVRALGSGKAIPQGPRTQTDSHPSQRTGSVGSFQDRGCQTQKGVVEWVTREPLLSTESRAIPSVLKNKRIAGAAIDAFDMEPLPPSHPFRTLDNVLATP